MAGQVLGLRPLVPAHDSGPSQRFYEAMGFTMLHPAGEVVILQLDGFGFIRQNFCLAALTENLRPGRGCGTWTQDGPWGRSHPGGGVRRPAAAFAHPI